MRRHSRSQFFGAFDDCGLRPNCRRPGRLYRSFCSSSARRCSGLASREFWRTLSVLRLYILLTVFCSVLFADSIPSSPVFGARRCCFADCCRICARHCRRGRLRMDSHGFCCGTEAYRTNGTAFDLPNYGMGLCSECFWIHRASLQNLAHSSVHRT